MNIQNLKSSVIQYWNIGLISIMALMVVFLFTAPLLGAEKEKTLEELQAEYTIIHNKNEGLYRSIELINAEILSNKVMLEAIHSQGELIRIKNGDVKKKIPTGAWPTD